MRDTCANLVEHTLHILDPDVLLVEGKKYLMKSLDAITSVNIYIYSDKKKKFFLGYDYSDSFYVPIGIGKLSQCFVSREIVVDNFSVFYPLLYDIGVIQFIMDRKFYKGEKKLLLEGVNAFSTILQNALSHNEIRQAFDSFVDVLSASIDARDYVTSGHSKRTALYADKMCDILDLGSKCRRRLNYASHLHDIGKIGIPESILTKGGILTESEYRLVKTHPSIGMRLIEKARFPLEFKDIPRIIESHHERYDGAGYPNGVSGIDIPFEARIIAIVDVFDALTSHRQYRAEMTFEEAIGLMRADSGQFDPDLFEIFLSIPHNELCDIHSSYRI